MTNRDVHVQSRDLGGRARAGGERFGGNFFLVLLHFLLLQGALLLRDGSFSIVSILLLSESKDGRGWFLERVRNATHE